MSNTIGSTRYLNADPLLCTGKRSSEDQKADRTHPSYAKRCSAAQLQRMYRYAKIVRPDSRLDSRSWTSGTRMKYTIKQVQPTPSWNQERTHAFTHFAIHFMNPFVSSSLFRFLPMNTILHLFSSSGAQDPCCEFAKSMWMAWKTNFSFIPFTAKTPLEGRGRRPSPSTASRSTR